MLFLDCSNMMWLRGRNSVTRVSGSGRSQFQEHSLRFNQKLLTPSNPRQCPNQGWLRSPTPSSPMLDFIALSRCCAFEACELYRLGTYHYWRTWFLLSGSKWQVYCLSPLFKHAQSHNCALRFFEKIFTESPAIFISQSSRQPLSFFQVSLRWL